MFRAAQLEELLERAIREGPVVGIGHARSATAEAKPAAPEGFEFDPARAESRLSALKNARALGLAEPTAIDLPAEMKTAVIVHKGKLTPEYSYLEAHLQPDHPPGT